MADNNKNFSDYLLDRKSLKTKLNFWRNICLVIIAFVALNFLSKYTLKGNSSKDYIATIEVKGPIVENAKRDRVFRSLASNKNAKAVILYIDSPGGTLYPGENSYQLVKRISKNKPVISIVKGYAASAAYMVALGSERIFARDSSVVGSVGAWVLIPDVTELTDKIGVKMTMLKSGQLKAQPQPFAPMSNDVRKHTQDSVDDAYKLFENILTSERKISKKSLEKISKGGVFMGKKALEIGLIDEIGALDEAKKYLQQKHKISKNIKTKKFSTKEYRSKFDEIFSVLRETRNTAYQVKNYISTLLGL